MKLLLLIINTLNLLLVTASATALSLRSEFDYDAEPMANVMNDTNVTFFANSSDAIWNSTFLQSNETFWENSTFALNETNPVLNYTLQEETTSLPTSSPSHGRGNPGDDIFVGESDFCKSPDVKICEFVRPRDLIFLVDASDSMDPNIFYGQMLDFVQILWCSLNVGTLSRGGLITFGGNVQTQIQLRDWTQTEWFHQVEEMRTNSEICCRCCTPTAEAFRAARTMFQESPSLVGAVQIVFVITDGDPWQQTGAAPTYYNFPLYGPGEYRYTIVPTEANRLKNYLGPSNPNKVRIMLIGVPNKHGDPPSIDYFKGIPDKKAGKGLKQCVKRGRFKQCVTISSPPFPIISYPLDKNSFVSSNWNVSSLLESTVDNLCEALPTFEPTLLPTTGSPTIPPSKLPTQLPTSHPSKNPTKSPSTKPTQSPTNISPTVSPTKSPTEKPKFNQLDLFIYLDRSRSMRWRADACRIAVGSDPTAADTLVCWKLFLGFTSSIVEKATQIYYDGSHQIGWADDFHGLPKGVRVWVYGFACAGGQSTPIVTKIAEGIRNSTAFHEALADAENIVPDGGTCPGSAVQRSLGFIMADDLINHPYKAGLLFTDGVFYDAPVPQQAAKGLAYFGVLTYAFGIAIPQQGNNYGLTPNEIVGQQQQLLAFTNGKADRVFNFGLEGYRLLDSIAQSFIEKIPVDIAHYFPRILERPFWCGFSSYERCLNTNPKTFNSAKYCKWIPYNPENIDGFGTCMYKDDCSWATKSECLADSYCTYQAKKCSYVGAPLV